MTTTATAAPTIVTRETFDYSPLACGHPPVPTFYDGMVGVGSGRIDATGRVMFPGYAVMPAGADGVEVRVCPSCADVATRLEMARTGAGCGYTSRDGLTVTTWTGGELARVVSRTDNGRQTWIRATTPDGAVWSGRGPSGLGSYVNLARRAGGA